MFDPNVFNDVPFCALLDAEEREVLAQQVSTHNIAAGEVLLRIAKIEQRLAGGR